jgi:hypothetical protein
MTTLPQHPIPDSYWVIKGQLLAGEYPRAVDEAESVAKLRSLLDAGVTLFIDLTEANEGALKPYDYLLDAEAKTRGITIRRLRLGWQDYGTPSIQHMSAVLDTIDTAIADGEVVYIHCWGGIGRTGAAVGCYLVRHGSSPDDALTLIAERRQGTPDGCRPSPETREQERFVRSWRPGQ